MIVMSEMISQCLYVDRDFFDVDVISVPAARWQRGLRKNKLILQRPYTFI